MRKLIYAINITLDGFADHEAMIADDELHDFFAKLTSSADLDLFGRKTYELLADYWPYAPDLPTSTRSEIDFANAANSIAKIVFSNTLEKAGWSNSRLVKGDAIAEVARLKEQPGGDILVGGLSLASSLVRAGLVDEFWFLIHPIILGKGKLLFESLHKKVDLELISTEAFKSGVIATHYRLKK